MTAVIEVPWVEARNSRFCLCPFKKTIEFDDDLLGLILQGAMHTFAFATRWGGCEDTWNKYYLLMWVQAWKYSLAVEVTILGDLCCTIRIFLIIEIDTDGI